MNKTELPLPAPHCKAHEDAGCYWPDMFSATQMREHAAEKVAAERERCAKLCESLGGSIDPRDPDEVRLAANSLAQAIREGSRA